MKAGTNLEKILDSGNFAVTAEVGPPKGASARVVEKKCDIVKTCADAINVTDNQTAVVRMSSMAGAILLKQMGAEPVMQMTCRDRNRIAIQSDILGAVALGIGNILCISGDHQSLGNHPGARGVYDIDSMQLIQTLKMLRDDHKFISGDDVSGDVPIFIGAVESAFSDPVEFRVTRLAKKVKAGADFIQTQGVFDVEQFAKWMGEVAERGLHEQTHILAGIIPMKSAGMARYMRDYVSGVYVPDSLVKRMENAEDAKEEGLKICLEIIDQIEDIEGIHGIHIMAVGWEDIVPVIVQKAGLLPRPIV